MRWMATWAALAAAAVATPALATLDPPTVSMVTDAYDPVNDIFDSSSAPGTLTSTLGGAYSTARVVLSPYAYAEAIAHASDVGQASTRASLTYDFYYQALDPLSFSILANYAAGNNNLFASVTGVYWLTVDGDALANISVNAGGRNVQEYACASYGGACSTYQANVLPTGVYTIAAQVTSTDANLLRLYGSLQLVANVSANGPYSTAYAKIDPTISLPAGFGGNPGDYALVLSQGVSNLSAPFTSGVPEPASWALLIAGFGLTGAAARRRRVMAG